MLKKNILKSRVLSLVLIGAFLFLLNPPGIWAKSTGSLKGIVYMENFDTPIKDAVVKIRNVETDVEYESEPSDKKGKYEIKDIEEGRYVLGISTDKGNYNYDFELFIKANEKGVLNLALEPGVLGAVLAKKSGGFFPIIIGGIAALLGGAGLIILSGDEEITTPSTRKK